MIKINSVKNIGEKHILFKLTIVKTRQFGGFSGRGLGGDGRR